MTKKRQLSESEKERVLQRHGRRCFVDGAPIPDEEAIDFHHVRPFTRGGPTNLDNVAPVCRTHHRSIGTMSLQEYRDRLELQRFFEGGEPKYLDDLIRHKRGRCGDKLPYEAEDSQVIGYYHDSGVALLLRNAARGAHRQRQRAPASSSASILALEPVSPFPHKHTTRPFHLQTRHARCPAPLRRSAQGRSPDLGRSRYGGV